MPASTPVFNPSIFRRKLISRFAWIFHPISVFVAIQVLSIAIISIWIVWFLGRTREIARLTDKLGNLPITVDNATTLYTLIVGVVFIVMILVGSVLLFVWGQRQTSFIRQQRSFVSSVTHELRTPLASLHLAYETMLSRSLSDENRRRLLEMNLLDIDRLIRLVNQILISSRLDRGLAMFHDDVTMISVKSRLEDLVKTLAYLDPSGLPGRVEIKCDPALVFKGSMSAFTLILGNLVENAIKYSPLKSPICIEAKTSSSNIQFLVSDKGIGLNKRDRRRIFKMFYRGDEATSRAIPGTGLGLFIVKTAVDQLGGSITVDSLGPGEGSVFSVKLPSYC